jgi:tetratricopeptide (TPR) repeat protein
MRRMRLKAWLAAVVVALAAPAMAAEEGKRVALIFGNDAYSVRQLQNAVNDARAMDKALRGAGFRTILRENATKIMMEQAAVEFLQGLGPDDTALFFFAGHAVQIENENVLIPVDFAQASTVIEAKFKSFSLGMIFDYLRRQRVRRSIVVIDACRSNPAAQDHSLEAGLAIPLNAGKETYIAFSTSPNRVATDNPEGKNSWFTEALADFIAQPAITIDEVFTSVRMRVEKATQGAQVPWSQTSLTGRFYFHPPTAAEAERDPTAIEKWVHTAMRHEQRENWVEAIDLLNQVLKQAPGGTLERNARRRLPYLAALNEAEARFEASDYAGAASLYDKAYGMDPFSTRAAFQGVDSYLLNDQLPEAVRLLQAIRVRGSAAAIARADAALKQLAAVSAEAGEELKAGVPQPPPFEEIFPGLRFGVPDWDAGRLYAQAGTVDLTARLKELALAFQSGTAAPSGLQPVLISEAQAEAPAGQSAAEAVQPASPGGFYVEVVSLTKSRDLLIREIGAGTVNTSGVQRPSAMPVKVTTDPPGAELTVGGDEAQKCASPCILLLGVSKSVVHARLEGFRTEIRVLDEARSGQEMHIPMERETGFMKFLGAQAETAILLDGKPVSRQVPATLQLPAGRYAIRGVREGKAAFTLDAEVKAMSTVEVSLEQ